jgi:uncharacterized membrane protein HdeD (DUF308 family)
MGAMRSTTAIPLIAGLIVLLAGGVMTINGTVPRMEMFDNGYWPVVAGLVVVIIGLLLGAVIELGRLNDHLASE